MGALDIDEIAARLEGLEETIIQRLIDRAQFCLNDLAYETGRSGFTGEALRSLFEIRLRYHEEMDARFGRYIVPEERPFTADLPPAERRIRTEFDELALDSFDVVNLTRRIKQDYLQLLPSLCRGGDDGHYGSSVEHDVHALQAISRRIHYGALYVAESKYRGNPGLYADLMGRDDEAALEQVLTRPEVEDRIYERVARKVESLQAGVNMMVRHRIEPELVVRFYRETVIPLTKTGEILYLQARRS